MSPLDKARISRAFCFLMTGLSFHAVAALSTPSSAEDVGQMLQVDRTTAPLEELRDELTGRFWAALETHRQERRGPRAALIGPASGGPGCSVQEAQGPSGAIVAEAYASPSQSLADPSLVGPLQLQRSGEPAPAQFMKEFPLYRGQMADGRNVFYVITDTTDEDNARELGINFSPGLAFVDVGRGARAARLTEDGLVIFEKGAVDFSQPREIAPDSGDERSRPPTVFRPGAVGDGHYTPLVKLTDAGGHIYNMPVIAFDVAPEDIDAPDGDVDHSLVHDRVLSIDMFDSVPLATGDPRLDELLRAWPGSRVRLELVPGFSAGKPVLYLGMDASVADVAGAEKGTFTPALRDVVFGFFDPLLGSAERRLAFPANAAGCKTPQGQDSAGSSTITADQGTADQGAASGGLDDIADAGLDYIPIQNVDADQWALQAEIGQRSGSAFKLQFPDFSLAGFSAEMHSPAISSVGHHVNAPIIYRFRY